MREGGITRKLTCGYGAQRSCRPVQRFVGHTLRGTPDLWLKLIPCTNDIPFPDELKDSVLVPANLTI